MSTRPPEPPPHRPTTGSVERLYVLWVVSVVLLVLLVIIVTLFTSGHLRQHAERLSEHTEAIEGLQRSLARVERGLAELTARLRAATPPPASPPPTAVEPPSQPPPTGPKQPAREETPPAASSGPTDRDMDARLQNALRISQDGSYQLANRAEAEATLREGLRNAGQSTWSGRTWSRLAVLARLLDRDAPAEMFALRAEAAGEPPQAYYELSASRLLAEQRVREAIVFAQRLATVRPNDPASACLLAETHLAAGDYAAAAAAIATLDDIGALPLPQRLRIGRLLVALEGWDRLESLLDSIDEPPPTVLSDVNFLRAVMAIQRGRLAEALAILDNLLVEQPEDYALRTWRGVALLEASQFQAAREALAHAEDDPDRPEAWYWRGLLEIRAGNLDEAVPFLQRALAASQRFAPAWEALGTIALNRGDLAAALQDLQNAVSANPRRASAHFLMAVAHAKAARVNETAEALRTAFRLAPSLLEIARQTEAISDVFSNEELEALAGVADAGPPEDSAGPESLESRDRPD